MKLCKKCRIYSAPEYCRRPTNPAKIDLVKGRIKYEYFCLGSERSKKGLCGVGGKFFKPKTLVDKIIRSLPVFILIGIFIVFYYFGANHGN